MDQRWLVAFVVILACAGFSDARNFPWPRPILYGDDAQKPIDVVTTPLPTVSTEAPVEQVQQLQAKQPLTESDTITWKYPEDPVDGPPKYPEKFELTEPEPSNRVAVRCGEGEIQVAVYPGLLGLNQRTEPEYLKLGGCSPTVAGEHSEVLMFTSDLHGCGSNLTITADTVIYAFKLVYDSQPLRGTSITRSGSAEIAIECHYRRNHVVSSNSLTPSWTTYNTTKAATKPLAFSLKLMTHDWLYRRRSNQYYMGDVLNMEASVTQYNHVPLRVFVDSCRATLSPDEDAVPRYYFVANHGCLVDAILTDSSSRFMARSQDDKLQFQLEAFKFPMHLNTSLYVTCRLKATVASAPLNKEHKACSFKTGSWTEAAGHDQLCDCCESSCSMRKARDVLADAGDLWQADATVGPIDIYE